MNLEAPTETPSYDDFAQRTLLGTYMAALLAVRPLPILGAIGNHGSGKSTLARAIGKAIIGPQMDLTAPGGSEKDVKALITSEGFAVLDNLDEQPDRYIPDVLASAATGAWVVQRLYYTNMQLIRRPPTAAVAVTSRTGILFQRPDLRDRCLPLFCGELDTHARRGDAEIIAEVGTNRDGILTWLARAAGRMMRELPTAPHGLPGSQHYPDFNRLAWLYMRDSGEQDEAETVLKAWRTAQELAITDLPPLADAVIQYLDTHEVLYGKASEIAATLEGAGFDIPFMGGGKAIARALREAKHSFRLAGIRMDEGKTGDWATFRLYKRAG